MRIAIFDIHRFEKELFESRAREEGHSIVFQDVRLTASTAGLARGCEVVCSFVNDRLDRKAIEGLSEAGVRLIALRSAGFNHVDLEAAREKGIPVVRVPAYSPYAVAEHATALLLTLNRKTHRAYQRVREMNFSLDGLVGFDLHEKTIGLIGTGRIGSVMARIMNGFGCRVLAFDPKPDPWLVRDRIVSYLPLEDLFRESDVISLHAPLNPATRHLIDGKAIGQMKDGVFLINTSRGALIDSRELIKGLKSGKVGAAGLDVYEEEESLFFSDHSGEVLQDDVLARLMTFSNVLITSHQGFLTKEALAHIAETTFENIRAFAEGRSLINQVNLEVV